MTDQRDPTSQNPTFRRVHVIINPAAGPDRPVLNTLNAVFKPADIEWDVSVTLQAGDAVEAAKDAVATGADAVVVYGGDGTLMEVAAGLMGTGVPLAVLPGGTANVMAAELGIPNNLAEASALICGPSTVRSVDMGRVDEHHFLLRVGIGFEAAMVKGADRELKDRVGSLAYALSALKAIREPQIAHYHLRLDGQVVETEGVTCIIANSGNLGVPGLSLVPTIDVSDGLLDVIVIRRVDINSLLSVAASVIRWDEMAEPMQHWQVRQVSVITDPSQTVQADGEVLGVTPITVEILRQAARIIVPADL